MSPETKSMVRTFLDNVDQLTAIKVPTRTVTLDDVLGQTRNATPAEAREDSAPLSGFVCLPSPVVRLWRVSNSRNPWLL